MLNKNNSIIYIKIFILNKFYEFNFDIFIEQIFL